MDNDGDLDIVSAGHDNIVYRNDGAGVFTDITAGDLTTVNYVIRGIAWGDMDGDGDLDLAAGVDDDVNRIFRNDSGTFIDVTAGDLFLDISASYGIAWGDADGDGNLDLAVGDFAQVNKIYRNDGSYLFLDSNTYSDVSAWGDMDSDGDLDFLVGDYGSGNSLYRNDGDEGFTDVTVTHFPAVSDNTRSIAWGDINGNGHLDLAVGNFGQVNRLYSNDGNGTFTDITAGNLPLILEDTESVAWGDFNGDGDLDLAVGNDGQLNRIYSNNGSGTFTDITTGTLPLDTDDTKSIAWGDMDGDGDLDLVTRQFC